MFNYLGVLNSAKQCRFYLINYETIRWRKKLPKPFWLGIAKSKMFKIPKKKEIPFDEANENERLTTLYDRQMRALQAFLSTSSQTNECLTDVESTLETLKAQSLILNDEWNATCARLREERIRKESQEIEENILKEIEENERVKKLLELKIMQIVKSEIEMSNKFITEENLESAIDECLNTIKDFNFALDLKGNIYKGSDPKPVGKLPVHIKNKMEDVTSLETQQSLK